MHGLFTLPILSIWVPLPLPLLLCIALWPPGSDIVAARKRRRRRVKPAPEDH